MKQMNESIVVACEIPSRSCLISEVFFFLLKQKKQESYGFYHFLES